MIFDGTNMDKNERSRRARMVKASKASQRVCLVVLRQKFRNNQ